MPTVPQNHHICPGCGHHAFSTDFITKDGLAYQCPKCDYESQHGFAAAHNYAKNLFESDTWNNVNIHAFMTTVLAQLTDDPEDLPHNGRTIKFIHYTHYQTRKLTIAVSNNAIPQIEAEQRAEKWGVPPGTKPAITTTTTQERVGPLRNKTTIEYTWEWQEDAGQPAKAAACQPPS